jgi:CheY-like chemotaxis protein/HPt (histidine-containing phosphotransfer) domain-containing protein
MNLLLTVFGAKASSGMAPGDSKSQSAGRRFDGVRALLADDNEVNRQVGVGVLRKLGCDVSEVQNGREALELLRTASFDIVFMDVQMPEMDGFEATRLIWAEGRWDDLAIIAMTAHAMKGDRERCLDAGMNDYIAKPIDIKGVRAALEKWLPEPRALASAGVETVAPKRRSDEATKGNLKTSERRNIETRSGTDQYRDSNGAATSRGDEGAEWTKGETTNGAGGSQGSTCASPGSFGDSDIAMTESGAQPMDIEKALERLGGDRELLDLVMSTFLKTLPQLVADLRSACAERNPHRLRAAAHSLKGSASTVSAEPVRSVAERLEELGAGGTIDGADTLLAELEVHLARIQPSTACHG